MGTGTVVISQAEYAELLRFKAAAMDGGTLAGTMPPFVKDHQPGKHMSAPERAEITRLYRMGYRPGEISEAVGRSSSTVSSFINAKLRIRS